MSEIRLSVQQDQEDTLSELVLSMEKLLGCKVTLSAQATIYEAESDNPKALEILQEIFSENDLAQASRKTTVKILKAVKKPVEKGKKPEKKERKKYARKEVLYTVLDGPYAGKELMAAGMFKMLKTGKLAEHTHLSHPEKGNMIVLLDARGFLFLESTDLPADWLEKAASYWPKEVEPPTEPDIPSNVESGLEGGDEGDEENDEEEE